jgi:photosystem II stability/assembly factor-like uncharacterized protein
MTGQENVPEAPNVLEGLAWRCIGPHRGGRVVAVAGHPTEPMTFYFGACAGGVWKTTDGGRYWTCVSDGFFSTAAIGALAIAESDPNVIYAGTGETTVRGNVSHGDGVYKSTDAGQTWTNVGLADTRHIAKIRVSPVNPDVVYVAALGHIFGPNRERGLYRSKDGGKTWEQILSNGEDAGAIDLSMDPHNPRILYCAFWDARRQPWHFRSGGPGSSLHKSIDGGDTWTDITRNEGLPEGVLGKIGVAVSPAMPGRVWALVEAKDGALFRSDDSGETWQRVSENGDLRRRAWYYMHVFADPQDADTVWVLNLGCWKSTDGGVTFEGVPTPHGDNHDLWIDPNDPQRMIEGNDGGACVTYNGGISWSTLWNQPTAQFYHVTADNAFPYRVYGSQQDNSAISLPSWSIDGAIGPTEWFVPGGGESGYIAIRPDNPNIIFAGAIGSGFFEGYLTRFDRSTGHERNITAWPEVSGFGVGAGGAKDLKYRFQWTYPIQISPHDPNILYVASNKLLRSTTEGASWEEVSPDLTRNDPSKQAPSGGPITKDNTGAEIYDTIFAFVESPHQQGLFWVGTDDGMVHLSRDGGATWEDITPPDLPEWTLVSVLACSPHDTATAYLAATRYKLDDTRPFLFKTSDYGKTWRKITNGIPDSDFTRVIREDPDERGLLYCGTETGIYVSFDDGENWERIQGNLPVAPIHDLVVKDGDLVVATHGRSFWILDDLTPLHQVARDRNRGSVRLFQPRPTYRRLTYSAWWRVAKAGPHVNYSSAGPVGIAYKDKLRPDGTADRTYLDAGQNPPNGVIVTYYLREKPEGDITLSFLDEAGEEIRTFTSKKPPKKKPEEDDEPAGEIVELGAEGMEGPAAGTELEEELADETQPVVPKNAGTNQFAWNLRYPEPKKVPDDKTLPFLPPGPVALPGRYQVRLTVGDQSLTQSFEIVPDPRHTASFEDLEKQFRFLIDVRDTLNRVQDAIIQIRDLQDQVGGWEKRLKGRDDGKELAEQASSLKKSLTAIEGELVEKKADSPLQYPERINAKLAALIFYADWVDAAPTHQGYDVFQILRERVETQLGRLQDFINSDLEAFNSRIREATIPAVIPKTESTAET